MDCSQTDFEELLFIIQEICPEMQVNEMYAFYD